MPSSIAADLINTRRLLLARANALENLLRKLAQRVASLEERQAAQTRSDPSEASSAAGKGVVRGFNRRAIGSQLAVDGIFHREDLEEAWRE
jgi:hypothetical protein